MRRRLLSCGLPALTVLLAACATPPPANPWIVIETTAGGRPLPGASCSVTTYHGSWELVTPASVPAPAAGGEVRVVCDRPGYRRSEVIYRPQPVGTGGGSQVGIGIGGGGRGGGIGIGLGVPIGGGASVSYPPQLSVEMGPAR